MIIIVSVVVVGAIVTYVYLNDGGDDGPSGIGGFDVGLN